MRPLSAAKPQNLRRLKRRALRGAAVALAVALPLLMLRGTRALGMAEAKSFDLRAQWTADASAAHPDLAVIAIDDNSLEVYRETLGRWPWPRSVHAMLLEYLYAAEARLVVFDIMFPEPDRGNPEGDAEFAYAIRESGVVVLPVSFTAGGAEDAELWERRRAVEQDGREETRRVLESFAVPAGELAGVPDFAYAEVPLPDFARGALALGSVRTTADPDGVVRRETPASTHRGRLYPSLALAAARLLEPERFGGPLSVAADELRSGRERIPLDEGRMVLRWRGRFMADGVTTYPVYPAFHVLNSLEQVATGQPPTVPLEAFRGKTVFVALTGMGLLDARATPLHPHDPGVMVHATQLDNLLRGDALRRATPTANGAALLAVALAVGLATALSGSALVAAAAAAIVLSGFASGAVWAYSAGVWVDLALPLFAGGVVFTAAMAANYVAEGRDKQRVRDLFGRYVSPEYVRRLAENPEAVSLGGERVPLTILFSDIRGFTSLSERLPAEQVIELLNEYLDAMAGVVFRHGGTLDKFIGDAVMAFWGAPVPVDDHARRAVDAALEMQRELAALNARWAARGAQVRLEIGIGINTGEAIVGNIGSLTRKLDYTAIGDAVNLASRLEGLNKTHGTTILASDATRRAAGENAYRYGEIGEVHVKGKENMVRIYEVRGARLPAKAPPAALAAPLAMLLLALVAVPVAGQQERGQWSASVYQPGAWRGAQMVPFATRNPGTDTLALVARVELFSRAPAWRAEVQRVAEGDRLEEPLVLVSANGEVRVVTAVGATPLSRHAAAQDPLVQAVVRQFDEQGRLRNPGAVRRVESTPAGEVRWVVDRRAAARPEVPDALFETRRGMLMGRQAGRLGVHAAGGERREEVVQTAAARGVVRVQTPDGEVTVNPDTAAVRRMMALGVSPVELDRFMQEGGVGPYAARENEPAVEVVP